LNDFRVGDSSSKNLLDSDVIGGEFSAAGADSMLASLGDQTTKEVFKSVLFGSNGGFHASENFFVVSNILNFIASSLI